MVCRCCLSSDGHLCLAVHAVFDVLSLGREHAVNLGIDYDKLVKQMLIVVAILVSVSTALVGPIMF